MEIKELFSELANLSASQFSRHNQTICSYFSDLLNNKRQQAAAD